MTIFAKLQMELAASAKDSALGYIDQIEQAQKDQKEIADMLQQCRFRVSVQLILVNFFRSKL